MDSLEKIYEKAINSNIIFFDEYFYVDFYIHYKDNLLDIKDECSTGYDYVIFKCRKLSYDIWLFLNQIEDFIEKEKTLLVFSLIESNICEIKLDKNIISPESIKYFFKLNSNIVKYVLDKINNQYFSKKDEYYRYELSKDFSRLYNSEKGVILEHKEISDYLTLTAFWEKLGLNYFDIRKLPLDVYKQLSLMMSIETETKNTAIRDSAKNNKNNNKGNNRRGR